MNHESEALCKRVLFLIFGYILRHSPSKRMIRINSRGMRLLPEIPPRKRRIFPASVDFSLFTPIRRPYYLRAVDSRYERHRFPDIQRTDYKSRACKCAFYRADSSKCSSRHRAAAAFEALRRKSGVSSIK